MIRKEEEKEGRGRWNLARKKKQTLPNFGTPSDVTNIPSQKKMTNETMDGDEGGRKEEKFLGLYSFATRLLQRKVAG